MCGNWIGSPHPDNIFSSFPGDLDRALRRMKNWERAYTIHPWKLIRSRACAERSSSEQVQFSRRRSAPIPFINYAIPYFWSFFKSCRTIHLCVYVSVQQINHLFAAISIAGYVRPCPHRIIFENFFFNFHFSFIINCIHFRNQPRDIFLIKMYFFGRETEF